MRELYSYKLKSHEDSYLINHLKFVGNRAKELIQNKDLKFSYNKELLESAAEVMGYSHDLGKGTSFFQQYLEDMIKYGKSSVEDKLKSHAAISALICYNNLRKVDEELALIGYVVVKRHHGNLNNFRDESNITNLEIRDQKKLIAKQYNALSEEIRNICNELALEFLELQDLITLMDEIYENLEEYNCNLEDNKDFEKYILFKYLFSVLIYADKEHAIFREKNNISYEIPPTLIDDYKLKKFRNSDEKNIRNIVYDDVLENIEKNDRRIMSITLPTGTGKTLLSMSAALKLKAKLREDMKIVYCLPFTSVIDQNFEEYKKAISTVTNEKVTSEQILKHHYLSPKNYEKSDFYYEGDEGRFLTQNWNSQIVVTTFIQFFNTVFSNNNSDLIKYNTLANSIVLLDEVQSIPYKYWRIINTLFKDMANKLNMYFIFITATQPLIFDKKDIFELAEKSESYFKAFKRTRLIVKEDPMEKEQFFDFARNIIGKNKDKNILIIVNTIRLSQELFNTLKDLDDSRERVYLSTSIVPKERKRRIELIKNGTSKKIVISTQMVEAGVDIDMDIVIRDMAPLDSINQSAGRANRENRGEYLGEVYLVRVEQNNKLLASFVYRDIVLLPSTEKVLRGREVVLEEDYKEISDSYFKELKSNLSNKESKKLENLICELEFEEINKAFQLIEDQEKISLFIEMDMEAKEVWSKYQEFKSIKDIHERRNKLETIKGELYQYVISVFKNKCRENINEGIGYISMNQLENAYDVDLGYKTEENSIMIL
ncbi:MAG: CRISPR-associated helicase Cas3' [Bacillota bacterium]|nr:CRISPR-associated helicase Cas3' [Bacillota bacterium]